MREMKLKMFKNNLEEFKDKLEEINSIQYTIKNDLCKLNYNQIKNKGEFDISNKCFEEKIASIEFEIKTLSSKTTDIDRKLIQIQDDQTSISNLFFYRK